MRTILAKGVGCLAAGAGVFGVSRILLIAPLMPTALAAWGVFCFLFSGELSGCKLRVRNGIEQKPMLRILWMIAGILCLLMAGGFLFLKM
ncbi:hypothetical protein HOJ44_01785 [Candidatus Bathyarchaeota archaeon]|jgi:hypothetical protein|nr:hypothetical protein [Candidatus Bathyarchaeota archaeon]